MRSSDSPDAVGGLLLAAPSVREGHVASWPVKHEDKINVVFLILRLNLARGEVHHLCLSGCYSAGVGGPSSEKDTRYNLARGRARALLTLTRQKPPVDLDAIIERAGVPVVERALEEGVRATIGDVAGQRAIILNRNHQIRSAGERRWILAEELGHVLLGHQLVNSDAPGTRVVGLREWRRVRHEREARAFAAELLMPFGEVSSRWFSSLRARPEQDTAERARRLASEFGVTAAAMRVRLEQMRILR